MKFSLNCRGERNFIEGREEGVKGGGGGSASKAFEKY